MKTINPTRNSDLQEGKLSWKVQDALDFRLNLVSPQTFDPPYQARKRVRIPTIVEPNTTEKPKEE